VLVLEVEVVVEVELTLVTRVVVVEVAEPPRAVRIPVYAGFLAKFESQGQAAPCPEKVPGTQEYLSVQSQMVIPTQPLVSTQAPMVLA
jgi:hypothetical protein